MRAGFFAVASDVEVHGFPRMEFKMWRSQAACKCSAGQDLGPESGDRQRFGARAYSRPRSASSRLSFGGISTRPALPLPRSAGASDGFR